MRSPLLIALDYDETYTEDPDLWLTFVQLAKMRGHQVILATMRFPEEGSTIDPRLAKEVKIVYTSRQLKKDFLASKGYYPDIWIDDSPHFIVPAGKELIIQTN